jgi:hypothetical protein
MLQYQSKLKVIIAKPHITVANKNELGYTKTGQKQGKIFLKVKKSCSTAH